MVNRDNTTQALATAWEENLGVSTEMHLIGWETYLDYLDECNRSKEELAACKLHAYIQAWEMDYGDPQNLLETIFAPKSPLQWTGWDNERYDELLALAATEYDTAQRAEYYKEADKILCQEDVAIMPIMNWQWAALVKEGVAFEYPPFGEPKFKHWVLP